MARKFIDKPSSQTQKAPRKLLTLGTVMTLALMGGVAFASTQDIKPGVNTEIASNLQQTAAYKPGLNKVTFQSEGVKMVGNLYLPADYKPGDKLPATVVTGAWTTVKEQMPDLYAKKLAAQGLATLTFDFRFWGESGGEPRQYESPQKKIQDMKNAVTYLQSLPMIDANRIGGLGVCASAGYMAQTIAEDNRFKSFVTVAAWLHDPESLRSVFGEEGVRRKMEAGMAAQKKYAQTGEVEYVPAYKQNDPKAAMSSPLSYYGSSSRGAIPQWKNQFAEMSWVEWLQFDALAAAPKVTIPTLFIHSDNSALPDSVRKFYNTMPGPKNLFWTQGEHTDFYDQEPYVTKAVQVAAVHFKNTLSDVKVSQK
ncbi:alpha/beta hydrolase [Nostocales cyanobacterium HT-58-2]|nr:alpha/beta hydrolase [Nostocales cyanobacterium HT-58-2]